jgi:hypothetical protein
MNTVASGDPEDGKATGGEQEQRPEDDHGAHLPVLAAADHRRGPSGDLIATARPGRSGAAHRRPPDRPDPPARPAGAGPGFSGPHASSDSSRPSTPAPITVTPTTCTFRPWGELADSANRKIAPIAISAMHVPVPRTRPAAGGACPFTGAPTGVTGRGHCGRPGRGRRCHGW